MKEGLPGGRHYRLDDARSGPQPVHPMEIWLGGFRPRFIRLVGQKADGWLPSLGVLTREELSAGNELIDEAAAGAGRDPRRIRRVLNLQGMIGDRRSSPSERLPVDYLFGEPLVGPPQWWAETLTGFAEGGFDMLVFWPVDAARGQVELLAGEVALLLEDRG
jgi:alkanesulfonate monooxygenase SsuD/methylene tetrahydromethanopterin reductase-like flavin-dependent oxidoreductase (luciferase family)